ncbi:GNAT family N-acetyltransferase, partial [candidate division KSB1 bacterium]|nr:GNAT family N-acetyltransferase [candidate division KSB1 bacterium]
MTIRPLRTADFEAALAIWNRSAAFDQMTPELFEEKVLDDPDYDPNLILLAEQENRPAGFIMGVKRRASAEGLGYVKLLAVDPSMRRQGIGRQLLQTLEQKLRAAGAKALRVFESNPNYLT